MTKSIKYSYLSLLFIPVFFLFLTLSCKKVAVNTIPVVKSLAATNLSATSVKTGGEVTSDGGESVIARGVCWSVKPNPTIKSKDSLTIDGTGIGIFTSSISRLNPGMTYYIRAYATNSINTAYGNQITAVIDAVLPILTTSPIIGISETSINSGGTISNDGGSAIIARGVCWSNKKNPTLADNVTGDGPGSGNFISSIENLSLDLVYYLRAYATNSIGTAYGNERSFSTGNLIVRDKDNNVYHFVTIGSQAWMVENLKTTKYKDSTLIPLITGNTAWSNINKTDQGYCWYDNDQTSANKNTYGALYNWYTVNTGKLCPTGWHVPTDNEWTTLAIFLGGESIAGGKLKETGSLHWSSPNMSATDLFGFSALPGGFRIDSGVFDNLKSYGNWWSSTAVNSSVANYRYIYFGNGSITKSFVSQKYGLSVKCLKD